MKYDFISVPDRHGNDALAVDGVGEPDGFTPGKPKDGFSLIPMWVADMNFKVFPGIVDSVVKRASHPSFGYFETREEYYSAIIKWQHERHGLYVERKNIGYENGVLGCLATALRVFTAENDAVLLHSPCYIGFIGTVERAKRKAVYSPLLKEDGVWRMDFSDMEKKIVENNIRFAVFCSPHNPTGRVWEKEEIERAMEIYKKHNVTVFADEIWSDIIMPGNKFIPTASVSDDAKMRTITACAPSKTFNLAGLIGSYHIIFNDNTAKKMREESAKTHYNSINVLSEHALIGAYTEEGAVWTDELCEVLSENIDFAVDFINKNFKGIEVLKPQGTYMLYLDLSEYLEKSGKTLDEVLSMGWDVGVAYQDGRPFKNPNTIRMNLALPTHLVKEAFERLRLLFLQEK